MRGGLDDALDKLARRDELRRRAAGDATGTPPPVTELVEAIAAVVGHHPQLGVTVGVEGAGEPMVLRFFFEDGQVQVTADSSLAARAADGTPRHADVEIEVEVEVGEPVEEHPYRAAYEDGGRTQRLSYDDQDRYGPPSYGYDSGTGHYESDTAERRYGSVGPSPANDPRYATQDVGESSRDLGARMRDLGMASSNATPQMPYPPHPFAATPPPPVPPQTSGPQSSLPPQYAPPPVPPSAQATRRIEPEHYRPPAEPTADERFSGVPEQRGMPAPLAQPIPLQVERPEQTEIAARRLAALLRDDPSLLNNIE